MTGSAEPETLGLIADRMSEFGAAELGRSAGELLVSMPVPLADGRVSVYRLSIAVIGTTAVVRETTPTLLPAFCPERHINLDGSFCLYWRAVDDIAIDCPDAARAWWETLVRFLQLQARAARLRRWPDGQARAHGPSAALHQLRAEVAAERLGDPFPSYLADRRLEVIVRGSGAQGPAVQVLCNGRWLFSVWMRSGRVVDQRRPCVCSNGARRRPVVLKSCGDHAEAAASLALELHRMGEEEERFWEAFRGSPCCRSMEDCPLADRNLADASGRPAAELDLEAQEMDENDGTQRQVRSAGHR